MMISMRFNDRIPEAREDVESLTIDMPDGTTWEIREVREDQLQIHCTGPTNARMSVVPAGSNLIRVERRK